MVTIATSGFADDGTAIAGPSVEELAERIEVPAEVLRTTLSDALGKNLTLTVSNATEATALVFAPCPKGHWCTGDLKVKCPKATFNDKVGQTNATGCKECPEHATTPSEAATSENQCDCDAGFVRVAQPDGSFKCVCPKGSGMITASGSEFCQLCREGSFKASVSNDKCNDCAVRKTTLATGAETEDDCVCQPKYFLSSVAVCELCPTAGTRCDVAGISVGALPLQPGYWRALNTTSEVRPCYDASFCPNDANNGTGATCATGHTGPFCAVCSPGFHKGGLGGCEECSGSWESTAVLIPAVLLLCGAVLLICAWKCRARLAGQASKLDKNARDADEMLEGLESAACKKVERAVTRRRGGGKPPKRRRIWQALSGGGKAGQGSIVVKLRILISTVQVLNGIGVGFDLRWPPLFQQMLRALSVVELNFVELMPIACVVPVSFHESLIFYTAAPLVLTILFGCCSSVVGLLRSSSSARVQTHEHRNAFIFLVLFLVYPGCVAKIFQAFQCISLPESGARYLRQDFGIECSETRHQAIVWGYVVPMVSSRRPRIRIAPLVWPQVATRSCHASC